MPPPKTALPIERRSARRAVYEHVRSWIADGFLEPGETISDREIAEQLGVSRTPVREALQMLELQGVVEMLPGRQTRVTETSPEDITLVYGPLAALEAFAAEIGAPRATALDITELRQHNTELAGAITSSNALAARSADTAFHHVFLRLADNRYLTAAIESLLLHVHRLEAKYFARSRPGQTSHDEHERIIAAMEAGEVERVRELTRSNFLRYWDPSANSIQHPSQQDTAS